MGIFMSNEGEESESEKERRENARGIVDRTLMKRNGLFILFC
jgi:hypothetical protein